MNMIDQIAERETRRQSAKDASEFSALVKFILAHGGKFGEACAAADQNKLATVRGLTPKTVAILRRTTGHEISRAALQKAASAASTFAGSAFQDVGVISSGFVNSLASSGVFDRMLPDMAQIPLQAGTVGAVTTSATALQIIEGNIKPISRLSVTGAATTPLKVHVCLVVSQELARSPLLAAGQLIQNELRSALAIASDDAFLDAVTAGVVPATSFGTSATNVRSDLEYLLRVTGLKQNSKPYLVTTPQIASTLSQMNNGGQAAFPELGPLGGSISGIPVLTSDAVNPGFLICIDASRIAAAAGEVMLQQLDDAILQLEDSSTITSPPSAGAIYTSLWQANLSGIRLERYMIASKLTTTAVAIINNPNSYIVGTGSP